jgi:hypothetical protein
MRNDYGTVNIVHADSFAVCKTAKKAFIMTLTDHDILSAIDCFGGMYCRVIATGQPVYVASHIRKVVFKCKDASGINGIGNGNVTEHYASELKSI